ncbi:hypothetical protein ANN_21492 [Periplaneta americana]|uniref:Uncharacterized protein n=1 Tax=Periplaneta americana TaxID=6978 RepID=A0ABQ8SFG1_PERAM|nr:hypothetical protein ANN_21492 [Periplaneta americana]
MSPGSSTESYPAFAHIGLRENPRKKPQPESFLGCYCPYSFGKRTQHLTALYVPAVPPKPVKSKKENHVRSLYIFLSLPSKETLRGHSDSSFLGEGYIQCCVGVRLCVIYSNQDLAEIHFMYGKADGNAALARRLYQESDNVQFGRHLYVSITVCASMENVTLLVWEGDDQDLQLQKYRRRFWRL